MPGRDRSGPMGRGPRCGRAAGYCRGSRTQDYAGPSAGQGRGAGWGRGFGAAGGGAWERGGGRHRWRHSFYATGLPGWLRPGADPSRAVDPGSETELLAGRAEALQSELEAIRKRLGELESGAAQESRSAE